MKRKASRRAKKTRQSRYARIAAAENSPDLRREIAKYGRHVPGVFRVEYWQKKFPRDAAGRPKIALAQSEKECLLSLFFLHFMALNDRFFDETAAAIRAFKKATPPDALLMKLSDPALWLAHPAPTLADIRKFCAPLSGDIERIVPRLALPYTKRLRGKPKKN
jgi:hypothetical protein